MDEAPAEARQADGGQGHLGAGGQGRGSGRRDPVMEAVAELDRNIRRTRGPSVSPPRDQGRPDRGVSFPPDPSGGVEAALRLQGGAGCGPARAHAERNEEGAPPPPSAPKDNKPSTYKLQETFL